MVAYYTLLGSVGEVALDKIEGYSTNSIVV